MVNHVFANGHYQTMIGTFNPATADMRLCLCMTNTTADTALDATFMSGGGDPITLDEYDDDAPAFVDRLEMGNETLAHTTGDNRVKFGNGGTNLTYPSLGVSASGRNATGVVVYYHITNDAASIPFIWLGFTSNIMGNGGDIVLTENASGFCYFDHPSSA